MLTRRLCTSVSILIQLLSLKIDRCFSTVQCIMSVGCVSRT